MKIGDKITDGSATFIVRSKGGGVQSVNNVRPDGAGNISIKNIDHANTADKFSKSGNELGALLWNMFHRYGVNYVPSDTTNEGWNGLGFCSIYYTEENKINNQPTKYGQLINIPADVGFESTQLWVEQPRGTLFFRGGNVKNSVNDTPFIVFEQLDSKGSNWIRYRSGLQICWVSSVAPNSRWNFPVAFSSKPVVQFTDTTENWSWISDLTNTGCTHRSGGTGNGFAIGWWK